MPSLAAIRWRPRTVFYGWYIVGASIAMNFYLSMAFFQGAQVFFLPILQEFGWSRAATSGAFSLRQLETGIVAPAVGFLVDRWGPRKIILGSVVIAGAGLVMMSAINSLWTFYLAFLVASFGVSGCAHAVTWTVVVANWFRRLRGRALGIATLGPVVGGPFIVVVALLEEWVGWRTAILALGIGMWVVGIPLAMVARSRPEDYGYLPDGDPPQKAGAGGSSAQRPPSLEDTSGLTPRQAMRTRDFWALSIIFGVQFIGTSGLLVHMIPLLEDFDYSSAQAAIALGLVFLLSGLGRIGAGTLADIFDRRLIMLALMGCQVVGLAILSTVGPSEWWKIGFFSLLYGVGFGGSIPLRPFLIRQIFGSRSFGSLQGLVQGFAIGAGLVGPVFWGRVFDVTQSYDIAIYATIAISLAVVPLVFLFRTSQIAVEAQSRQTVGSVPEDNE